MARLIMSSGHGILPHDSGATPAFVIGGVMLYGRRLYPNVQVSCKGPLNGVAHMNSDLEFASSRGFISSLAADCVTYSSPSPIYGVNDGVHQIKPSIGSKINLIPGISGGFRRPKGDSAQQFFTMIINSLGGSVKGIAYFCCSYDLKIRLIKSDLRPETDYFNDPLDGLYATSRLHVICSNSFYDSEKEGVIFPAGSIIGLIFGEDYDIPVDVLAECDPNLPVRFVKMDIDDVNVQGLEIMHRGVSGATPTETFAVAKSAITIYYNSELTGITQTGTKRPLTGYGFGRMTENINVQ